MLVDATWGRPPERVGVTCDVFDTSHGGLRMALTFADKASEVGIHTPSQFVCRIPTQVTFTAEEVCNWDKDNG